MKIFLIDHASSRLLTMPCKSMVVKKLSAGVGNSQHCGISQKLQLSSDLAMVQCDCYA